MPLIVHPVKTLTVSLPNAFSTAPPPRDDPIPAFADGFCMSITKITKTLVQININVSNDERNEAIDKQGDNLNLTDKKNTSIWERYYKEISKMSAFCVQMLLLNKNFMIKLDK